jgi:chorismate lyase/3-hydroxybenzoate synthase
MSRATADFPPLRIMLGTDARGVFDAGLPVLAGETEENLFGPAQAAGSFGPLALFSSGDWWLGAATVPVTAGVEHAAFDLYRNIFSAAQGRHLARIWNYVPAINEAGPTGLENYRAFCRGRSLAFEQHYGTGFKMLLPSASAVGSKAGSLTVAFAASTSHPRHVENPLQVPAYDYPTEHGPRAPSFARATVVADVSPDTVFISGTAAIRGHATIAPNSLRQQLDCALENLQAISAACGLGPGLGGGARGRRYFKVYVRHAADQPVIAAILQERLLVDTDRISYVLADICRAALLVEIEASLFGVVRRTG